MGTNIINLHKLFFLYKLVIFKREAHIIYLNIMHFHKTVLCSVFIEANT